MTRNTRKIVQALAYLAYQQSDHVIDSMKAYKLLWLADRYHLRKSGRTISGDVFYALPHGVVPSDAKCVVEHQKTKLFNDESYCEKYLKPVGKYQYMAVREPDLNVFSDSDQEALDKVLAYYNQFSSDQLSEQSHDFPEWLAYKQDLDDVSMPNAYKIDIDLFFNQAEKDKSGLFNDPQEFLEISKAYFHEFEA